MTFVEEILMGVSNCGTEDYLEAKRLLSESSKVADPAERADCIAAAQVHATLVQTAVWVAFGIDDMVEPARSAWAGILGLGLDDVAGCDMATVAAPAATAPVAEDFTGQVRYALRQILPPRASEPTINSDAFGALVYRLREFCDESPNNSLVSAFRAIGPNDLSYCEHADDPAAFLAAKIRDLL